MNTSAKTSTTAAAAVADQADGDVIELSFADVLLADVGDTITAGTFKGTVLSRPSGKTATVQVTTHAAIAAGAAVTVS